MDIGRKEQIRQSRTRDALAVAMPLLIWNERGGSGYTDTIVVTPTMPPFDLDISIIRIEACQ